MNTQQFIKPLGGLDLDSHPLDIAPGDYTDALNIQFQTYNTESGQSAIPVLGNTDAFVIQAPTAQNKSYRIPMPIVAGTPRVITIYKTDGTVFFTVSWVDGASIGVSQSNFATAINAAAAAASPAQAVVLSNNATTTDVTLNTVTGYEYTLLSTAVLPVNDLAIIQLTEAISSSLTGTPNPIASWDLMGDLFVWSTPNTNLPSTIIPTIATASNASPIVISTGFAPHGLSNGNSVVISGVTGSTTANGTWIIGSVTTTSFTLLNSLAGGAGTGGSITIDTESLGELGVATLNVNTNQWTYTRLMRSKEWNFRLLKQIDCYVERTAIKTSFYFTDFYNIPRNFYYSGPYVSDGAINYINTAGLYSYGSISTSTVLQLRNLGATFAYSQQIQSGGQVISGNWRYSYRYVTSGGSTSAWSELTNPVPVYTASTTGNPNAITGDDAGTITSKINVLTLTNIPTSIFTYVELAGINYINGGVSATLIRREVISGNSVTLQHTGTESGAQNLDAGTFNDANVYYATAKNIAAIDNRLLLSNLTVNQNPDLSAWAQTFTHTILRVAITGQGSAFNGTNIVAEYSDPLVVNTQVGYMYNETYRFGVKVTFKNSNQSQVYWVDDIRIDAKAINVSVPNRRTGSVIAEYDLTVGSQTYVPYVEFNGIALNYLVNGVKISDLISSFEIVRCECVPEILATGMGVLGCFNSSITLSDGASINLVNGSGAGYIGEFPMVSGLDNNANPTYPDASTAARNFVAFYSPDLMYKNKAIAFLASDYLLSYGSPTISFQLHANSGPGSVHYYSQAREYTGVTGFTSGMDPIGLGNPLSAATTFASGTFGSFGGSNYTKILKGTNVGGLGGGSTGTWNNYTSLVIKTVGPVLNASGNADYACYYMQYYRAIGNSQDDKYGSKTSSIYISTGTSYTITPASPTTIGAGIISVFGGDTFCQKSYLKFRYQVTSTNYGPADLGYGGGISYYSQNRVNAQMVRRYNSPSSAWVFPNTTAVDFLESVPFGDPVYNKGYNISNQVQSTTSFNALVPQNTSLPARIIYSPIKPQDSLSDQYRAFLPLDFKDLDQAFGEIVHMAIGNGELITWQSRSFQRQYFNTAGVLSMQNGAEVVLGSGSVLGRRGQTMTTYGCQHKWAIIKGKSEQGNDEFYWLDVEAKKIIRFGLDGTVALSDIHHISSFLYNNLTWVIGKDTPAAGQGICGVTDDAFRNVYWTVRGTIDKSVILPIIIGDIYNLGNVGYNPIENNPTNWEKTGEFYICTSVPGVTITSGNIPGDPNGNWTTDWVRVSHKDTRYFSEFTIAFNEKRNKFTSFFTFLPKIFMKWTYSFLTGNPRPSASGVWLHNTGISGQWYLNEISEQADSYIEVVANILPAENKNWDSLDFDTAIVPYRVEFTNQNQVSFLTTNEFEARETSFASPIKEDSTVSLVNDGDTSLMYGKWLKIKLTMQRFIYQRFTSVTTKMRVLPRITKS